MSLFDFTSTINALGGPEEFTVSRSRKDGQYVKGRYQKLPPETFCAEGAIQPADADSIRMLPEGVRADTAVNVWTTCELRTARPPNQDADILLIRGEEYEVHMVKDWDFAGGYHKATCVRVGQ